VLVEHHGSGTSGSSGAGNDIIISGTTEGQLAYWDIDSTLWIPTDDLMLITGSSYSTFKAFTANEQRTGTFDKTIQYTLSVDAFHNTSSWVELYIDGTSELMVVPQNTAWAYDIKLIGITVAASKSWIFNIEGGIKRGTGNVSLIYSTTTTGYTDDANYQAATTANTTNQNLTLAVRDSSPSEPYDRISWVATVTITETYRFE